MSKVGRPSNAEIAARENKRVRLDAKEMAEKIRRSRVGMVSGVGKRLPDYGDNPGWKRRWVNDENIPLRNSEGYRFVTKDEVNDPTYDPARGDTDPSNYICRPVGGTNERGEPRMAYLMEIPQEIATELDYEKSLKHAKLAEQSIKSGTVGNPQSAGEIRIPNGVANSIQHS